MCCCRSASSLRPHARGSATLRNHIIVVGLSELGIRVVTDLINTGHDVAVIERDEENRFLSMAQELDVPVIFGDATLLQTLESARVDRARAVAVVTRDDMINIETGIVLAEMLGPRVLPEVNRRAEVPLVLRVYDRTLGFAVAQRFGFDNVRSTVELAAPWFIGAASGLEVLGTFSVGQSSFMVGAMRVAPGSELDGLQMSDLSTQIRVIAFDRQDDAPSSCGRAGITGFAQATRSTWSARIGNCWARCAGGCLPANPRPARNRPATATTPSRTKRRETPTSAAKPRAG